MHEHDGVVPNNGPYQGKSCSTLGQTPTPIGTRSSDTHIKLVHWNEQGAITKTSAIKTVIIQDDLHIVMIHDTRYKHKLDDLPNLMIQSYHTYHITMDEGGHGMVTIIKHTIPSEKAEQIQLGDGTETLSTRIWLNNKPILLHNIYRVYGELDITMPLSREPRSITLNKALNRTPSQFSPETLTIDNQMCTEKNRMANSFNNYFSTICTRDEPINSYYPS